MSTNWHPATTATHEQTLRANELLHATLAAGTWREGVLAEEGGVQYRGAYHPNANGSGRHPGVEVWLPEASPMAKTTNVATDHERELVLAEGEKRGWPRAELDAAISIESGWNPSAHNVQKFGGLIGFSPGFARQHVGSPEALWSLSIAQQAPLVGKYFDGVAKRWRVPGDTYLALAAPAFVGAPDSTIVYKRGTKAWEQNPGWRGPDGEITAASIRGLVLRRMAKGVSHPAPPKEPTGSPTPLSEFLLRLLSAMGLDGSSVHFGPQASEVVRAYQRERGLKPDGIVGPIETIPALKKDVLITKP